ncbi:phage infection protein [Dehalococcoides mccartyi]|uniref:phage infection protein n=1 Tax=Dehalococcoides mccartyi TaxID=61435 RepID=UPI00107EAC79|nr:phage infection protein [Dehalococcoides mccartyi]QBX63359.1 phage infection protein [Dehalococcoides mccartyi]
MKKLIVDLENCYGIKKLKTEFDFSKREAYAIYAPNGSMKSCLAQTFKDVADGVASRDRIFPNRVCNRKIIDENGLDLPKESILVIRPYDEVFGHTEKTSTLLVDAKLREEYEQLHIDIDKSKEMFLKALKEQSHSKKDLEKEISSTFTRGDHEFYRALIRIKDELLAQNDAPFADILYDKLFDEKVLSLLQTKDFKTAIEDYIKKYNELLAASTYFKKGTFNYYNASTIAKSLAVNGFFDAKHSVNLNANEKLEITSQKQLEDLITKEKDGISNDKELRKKFAEIEKQIEKNTSVRDFGAYLADHEELLPKLANVDSFKEEIWKSYFKKQIGLYTDLIDKYQAAEKRKKEIEAEAGKQRTQWEFTIESFNKRFFVPFKLNAKNRVSVILGQEPMLVLGFTFEDGPDTAPVEKEALMEVLSTGEKKALYILNIIFEVEARKKAKQETIFVVDDIADSFDYKNKYAIIQYLQDIAEEPYFNQIMLTHNFDFFRTVNSRFVNYSHCLIALKSTDGISLNQATGIKNVFVNDWKPNFFTDSRKRIASIPFIRNIIEFTKGDKDPNFLKLTSLLHWKADSSGFTQNDLDEIYNSVFGSTGASPKSTEPVIDLIQEEASKCLKDCDGINFENKIVLSIAIRTAAERFMTRKIHDDNFVNSIDSNQTPKLLAKFRELFANEVNAIETIQRVTLMTPENIHLNSFMYEPILDMSDDHLRKLYADVLALE